LQDVASTVPPNFFGAKRGRAKFLRLRAVEDDDKRRSIVVINLGLGLEVSDSS